MQKRFLYLLMPLLMLSGCTVQYKFNGASINYDLIKSISILDFPNQAVLVYAPLSNEFTEGLKNYFAKQTKLRLLQRDGDLNLEGEIVGYDLTPMAAQSDGYASETKLTVTINVRYTNTKKPDEDFEERFSAYRTFDASEMLDDVQEDLNGEIIDEIAEQIFNKAVANW